MRVRERADDLILGMLLVFALAGLCLILCKGGAVCLQLLAEPPAQIESGQPFSP